MASSFYLFLHLLSNIKCTLTGRKYLSVGLTETKNREAPLFFLCPLFSFRWEVHLLSPPRPIPQATRGRSSPLARPVFFYCRRSFQKLKKQAAFAAVAPPTLLRFQIACCLEILNCPLDGGFGESQILGNSTKGRPAFSLLVRPVVQIDVDRSRPMGQKVVCINLFQLTQ